MNGYIRHPKYFWNYNSGMLILLHGKIICITGNEKIRFTYCCELQ